MSKGLSTRALNNDFYNEFLNGELSPLLELVKKDHTLCMELRGKNVVIYYRGGLLYKIDDKRNGNFKISYNENYKTMKKEDKKLSLIEIKTVYEAVNEIARHKQDMDIYFSKYPKLEKEYQQLIVRDNNFSGSVSHATDYFILDIEYAFNDKGTADSINARFDMLAVKWLSTSGKRKNIDKLPISLIEVKYGDGAVSGDAGISKHIEDYITLRKKKEEMKQLAEDMEIVFKQKHTLGLITSYDDKNLSITIDADNVEYIFIFANHDPDKTKLYSEILEAIKIWKGTKDEKYLNEIKIAKASEMGYGLFAYKKGKEALYPTIEEYAKFLESNHIDK